MLFFKLSWLLFVLNLYKFRFPFQVSWKNKTIWNLTGISFNLWINLEKTQYLYESMPCHPSTWYIFIMSFKKSFIKFCNFLYKDFRPLFVRFILHYFVAAKIISISFKVQVGNSTLIWVIYKDISRVKGNQKLFSIKGNCYHF